MGKYIRQSAAFVKCLTKFHLPFLGKDERSRIITNIDEFIRFVFTWPWSPCDFGSFFSAICSRSGILLLQKLLDLSADLSSVFCTKWCPTRRQNLETWLKCEYFWKLKHMKRTQSRQRNACAVLPVAWWSFISRWFQVLLIPANFDGPFIGPFENAKQFWNKKFTLKLITQTQSNVLNTSEGTAAPQHAFKQSLINNQPPIYY